MSNKLDLHNIKHCDVYEKVEEFVLISQLFPLNIITGNSNKMKEIVYKVLDKHNFKYGILKNNLGNIVVYS